MDAAHNGSRKPMILLGHRCLETLQRLYKKSTSPPVIVNIEAKHQTESKPNKSVQSMNHLCFLVISGLLGWNYHDPSIRMFEGTDVAKKLKAEDGSLLE